MDFQESLDFLMPFEIKAIVGQGMFLIMLVLPQELWSVSLLLSYCKLWLHVIVVKV